jgi:hypothetical protein
VSTLPPAHLTGALDQKETLTMGHPFLIAGGAAALAAVLFGTASSAKAAGNALPANGGGGLPPPPLPSGGFSGPTAQPADDSGLQGYTDADGTTYSGDGSGGVLLPDSDGSANAPAGTSGSDDSVAAPSQSGDIGTFENADGTASAPAASDDSGGLFSSSDDSGGGGVSLPASVSGAMVGAYVGGPIGAIVGGLASAFLTSKPRARVGAGFHKSGYRAGSRASRSHSGSIAQRVGAYVSPGPSALNAKCPRNVSCWGQTLPTTSLAANAAMGNGMVLAVSENQAGETAYQLFSMPRLAPPQAASVRGLANVVAQAQHRYANARATGNTPNIAQSWRQLQIAVARLRDFVTRVTGSTGAVKATAGGYGPGGPTAQPSGLVWSPHAQGWTHAYPGHDRGVPPPAGLPVY